ncbi:MAG: hypothetical protein WCO52_06000 [bacterium]
MSNDKFDWFGFDEDPIGKYKQPKQNTNPTKQGYPQDDMNLTGTKSKGRFIDPYGKKKNRMEMRGYGAAERGREFYSDIEDHDPVRTKG